MGFINENKIARAIGLLKEFEPYEGYHLAFSGGKDSICIYHLAKQAKVKFSAYYAMTSVDLPDVIKFTKSYFPDVSFLRPQRSMFQLIVHKRFLPSRRKAYCCEQLKEYAGIGEFVILGIRWQESKLRSKRQFFEVDRRKKMQGKKYLNPIIDWTSKDVWTYITQNNLPFPDLYLGCHSRIGCIGCPKAYYKNRQREFNLYPRHKRAYIIAIGKAMEKGGFSGFDTPQDVFNWWISDEKKNVFLAKKTQLTIPNF